MGQKTHPIGFRLGINRDWLSTWYADKNFKEKVLEDYRVRELITNKLARAGLERINIERSFNDLKIIVSVSRPGVVIGRGGAGIELLREELALLLGLKPEVEVLEVKEPDLSAELVAQNIKYQLESRRPFRRVMKFNAEKVMLKGAKGVKIMCKGLIGGTKIARSEMLSLGSVPLQSIRSKIDYALATANTKKGTVGIKVWIYRGENKD